MSDVTGPFSEEAAGERMRGSNQSGLRAHNERAVLSLIRRNGVLAKADIARRTGLSPQTASVIMRELERQKLVLRDAPRRGRVGQPSIPMRLNPDGAFSLGLKLGRRSVELVLMDFVGVIRERRRASYPLPVLGAIKQFVVTAMAELCQTLDADGRARIAGLGVAMPSAIWEWGEEIGAPAGEMDEWRGLDITAELATLTGYSVDLANDATAACAAEHVFGTTRSTDYVYFYVGTFVGGGIVIDGNLVVGRNGNAGALGSMPVPRPAGPDGAPAGHRQLIHSASIHLLEQEMRAAGKNPRDLWNDDGQWPELGPLLDRWLDTAAFGLAHAIVSAMSVYDFECAVIDGSIPLEVRDRLVAATQAKLAEIRREGLSPIRVQPGTIGASAREIGAASLPFFAKFLLDHRVLFTERV